MASFVGRSLISRVSRHPPSLRSLGSPASCSFSAKSSTAKPKEAPLPEAAAEEEIPTAGISRPLSEILRELSKKIPDSFIKTRVQDNYAVKYIPCCGAVDDPCRVYLMNVPEEIEKTLYALTQTYVGDAKDIAATPTDIKELPNVCIFVTGMPEIRSGEMKVQVKDDNVLVPFISSLSVPSGMGCLV